jgi:hypothetical protein
LKPSKKAFADLARAAAQIIPKSASKASGGSGVKETPVFFIAAFYQN